jgi:hypothetical protein
MENKDEQKGLRSQSENEIGKSWLLLNTYKPAAFANTPCMKIKLKLNSQYNSKLKSSPKQAKAVITIRANFILGGFK